MFIKKYNYCNNSFLYFNVNYGPVSNNYMRGNIYVYIYIFFNIFSQRTVNSVISGVQQYQAALLDTLRERIRRVFEENPETTAQLQDEALATFDTFTDPFSTTAYGQNKTIRELFNPVNPEEVVSVPEDLLGKAWSFKGHGLKKQKFLLCATHSKSQAVTDQF